MGQNKQRFIELQNIRRFVLEYDCKICEKTVYGKHEYTDHTKEQLDKFWGNVI